jgi:hypothetical protein
MAAGEHLRRLESQGRLRDLIGRLDDLLPSLPSSRGDPFWPALARTLIRSSDWIKEPESSRDIADDAATMLVRLGLRDENQIPRVKRIIDTLISEDDLTIVPWIVRKHMFAYGLTRHGGPRSERMIYSKEETLALLESEIPRYRHAVLDGTTLRRITNVEAMFAISNRDLWDGELRRSLTVQMVQDMDALNTFAALVVPPGHVTDRSTLDELLDAEAIAGAIEEQVEKSGWPDNVLLEQSLRRLRRILTGRDPHFDDDDD